MGRRRSGVRVLAPMDGTVVPVTEVPDPVFAGEVVGVGLAIRPREPDLTVDGTRRVVVGAPCDGRVVTALPHAVVVQAGPGRGVLVHLGVGTRSSGGEFELVAAEGDVVCAGQPLVVWSPSTVRTIGRSNLCPVVALQAGRGEVERLVADGVEVSEGEALLLWS